MFICKFFIQVLHSLHIDIYMNIIIRGRHSGWWLVFALFYWNAFTAALGAAVGVV